jgi:hypothetical protein
VRSFIRIASGGLVLGLGLGLASTASGQSLDWGIISTAGDPDPVHVFDLANPGASNVQLGLVQTNNNRGMDFFSRDGFYFFVSTDALNQPGERGLWRWNNGVVTQLFNTPFSDGGDGDATLSNDGSRFYVTVDDGDATAGDSLYAFDNLNGAVTFTEIGETGLTQLFGIAIDPLSGSMYGVNGADDSFYKIDTTTGLPTIVGAVGQTLGAIGGMDFSVDGSTLLMSDAGELFTIDKTTGLATPAGDTTRNDSALSYRVPEPSSLAIATLGGLYAFRRAFRRRHVR